MVNYRAARKLVEYWIHEYPNNQRKVPDELKPYITQREAMDMQKPYRVNNKTTLAKLGELKRNLIYEEAHRKNWLKDHAPIIAIILAFISVCVFIFINQHMIYYLVTNRPYIEYEITGCPVVFANNFMPEAQRICDDLGSGGTNSFVVSSPSGYIEFPKDANVSIKIDRWKSELCIVITHCSYSAVLSEEAKVVESVVACVEKALTNGTTEKYCLNASG